MNFFRNFWPKLLQPPIDLQEGGDQQSKQQESFMSCFITPLLKATKKGTKTVLSFYSSIEYNKWKEALHAMEQKKWNIKYYKGLGTR
jgi:DNA topoisomerase II